MVSNPISKNRDTEVVIVTVSSGPLWLTLSFTLMEGVGTKFRLWEIYGFTLHRETNISYH